MTTHGHTCRAEPLSLWCVPCRLARNAEDTARELGRAQTALGKVLDPTYARRYIVVEQLAIAIDALKQAQNSAALALEYAEELAEKEPA
jgi:hypothetical protein